MQPPTSEVAGPPSAAVKSAPAATTPNYDFPALYEQCKDAVGFVVSRTIDVSSDAIIVKNADRAPDLALMNCLLKRLDASPVMLARLETTRALDGVQAYEDQRTHLKYEWTYSPQQGVVVSEDDGITLTVERLEPTAN